MEAILAAVGSMVSGITNLAAANKQARYERLPDWMSPVDFQRKDYTMELVIGGMVLVFLTIVIATAVIAAKKAR